VFECLRAGIYTTCELEHPLRGPMDTMIKQIENYTDELPEEPEPA